MEKFYHNYCRWIEGVIVKDDLSSLVDDRRTMPDAIVIGSGIGGLVAASLLARYGKDVLVWESHGIAGVRPEDIVLGFQHPSKRPKN